MSGHRKLAGITLAVALLGTAGCGKIAEKAAEKVTEEAIENAGGSGVDVDLSNGGVSYTDANGNKVTTDADGNVTITDADGNLIEADAGGDAEVPAEWPPVLAPPADARILYASSTDGHLSLTASVAAPDLRTLYDGLKAQVTGAGYAMVSDGLSGSDAGTGGVLTAKDADDVVTVAVAPDASGTQGAGRFTVIMSIDPVR